MFVKLPVPLPTPANDNLFQWDKYFLKVTREALVIGQMIAETLGPVIGLTAIIIFTGTMFLKGCENIFFEQSLLSGIGRIIVGLAMSYTTYLYFRRLFRWN